MEYINVFVKVKIDDDKEYVEMVFWLVCKLLRMVYKIFFFLVFLLEYIVFWYDDFLLKSFFVDDNGCIIGVIGWYVLFFYYCFFCVNMLIVIRECVLIMLCWMVC